MQGKKRWFIAASLFALSVIGLASTAARADNYPTHPVRLISDSAPGSAIDVAMRIIADGLTGYGASRRCWSISRAPAAPLRRAPPQAPCPTATPSA